MKFPHKSYLLLPFCSVTAVRRKFYRDGYRYKVFCGLTPTELGAVAIKTMVSLQVGAYTRAVGKTINVAEIANNKIKAIAEIFDFSIKIFIFSSSVYSN
ncbi:MAG: hypothetical protein CW691_11865 [Candidatus Bathyarchaeum sp.]|nr:MAG: hypothetical protein CW691_11865 [Candidatus Bathyarchaeum sp.]